MTFKTWQKWTLEEVELLKQHWQFSDMQTLLKTFPKRDYNSLMLKARLIGVKSIVNRRRQNGSLDILREKTKDAFYLWGFLLADGCFTTKDDVTVSQHAKEKEFFEKFIQLLGGRQDRIKFRTHTTSYSQKPLPMMYYRSGNKAMLDEMRKRIGLRQAKTYNPPTKINYFFERDLFLNFMTGLIDGDGCIWITKSGKTTISLWPNIRIEMHYNWLPILDEFKRVLFEFYGVESRTRVSNRGYAQLIFAKKEAIKVLLDASEQTLRMERKWEKLNQFYADKRMP